jgi:serine/threonine-protein kinase
VLAPGTIIEEKFRLDRVIASGGMGVVFAATHTALGRAVAVKILKRELADDARAAARLLAEARAAAALKSPYIADVIDVGMHDSVPFIVMELLVGRTSYDIVRIDGPMTVERACDLLIQACHALGEAHRRGVIHRDVKPSNLFVTQVDERERLKVIDFGISKRFDAGQETTTGTFLGSPSFMSPEQVRSARDVDGRSDIWSLGVVLYFLLTGKRPFEAESLLEQMTLIVHEPAPHVAGEIDEVFQRCLMKDPEERFATTADLARALAKFASPKMRDLAAKVPVGAPPMRSGPSSRSRPAAPPPPPEEPTAPATARPSQLETLAASTPRPRRRAAALVWIGVGIGAALGAAMIGVSSRRATPATTAAPAPAPAPSAAATPEPSAAPAPLVASTPADSAAPPTPRAHARPRPHASPAPVPPPTTAAPPPARAPDPPTVKSGLPRVPD